MLPDSNNLVSDNLGTVQDSARLEPFFIRAVTRLETTSAPNLFSSILSWTYSMYLEILAKYPDFYNLRSIEGCSDDEIDIIEKTYDLKLPYSYKTFLKEMGKNPSSFMIGTDFSYGWIDSIQNGLSEILSYNNIDIEETFCVMLHQGYVGNFFFKNNPEKGIFGVAEGDSEIEKVANDFEEFFLNLVNYEVKYFR